MQIKDYDQLNSIQLDALNEVGNIGSGNAATALSSIIGKPIYVEKPRAEILEYGDAVDMLGGPENIVAAVMMVMSGDIKGIMLFMQDIEFVNLALGSVLNEKVKYYDDLSEMDRSALIEIGNIMLASYTTALATLAGMKIDLSVPNLCINMAGGILSVPMVQFGYETDKLLILYGDLKYEDKRISSRILMLPDVKSLNYIMKKLGVESE